MVFQKHCEHRLPRQPEAAGRRVNLTWRWAMAGGMHSITSGVDVSNTRREAAEAGDQADPIGGAVPEQVPTEAPYLR